MRKSRVEPDGSFYYSFGKKEIKELILAKYPNLIDGNHKLQEIDLCGLTGKVDIIVVKRSVRKKNGKM